MRQTTQQIKDNNNINTQILIRTKRQISAQIICVNNNIVAVRDIASCDTSYLNVSFTRSHSLFASWFQWLCKMLLGTGICYVVHLMIVHTIVQHIFAYRTIFMNFTNQILHFNIYSMQFTRNGGDFYSTCILMLGKFHLHTFGRFAWIASDGCAPCKTNRNSKLKNSTLKTRTTKNLGTQMLTMPKNMTCITYRRKK